MNSRERVLKTINHEEPDRVPVGEWAIDHDHVSRIIGRPTYFQNRKETVLALWDNRRDEVVESYKKDFAEVIEKLDHDIIPLRLVPSKSHHEDDPPERIAEDRWENSKGETFVYSPSNDNIVPETHPEGKETLTDEDIDEFVREKLSPDDSCFELADYMVDRFGDEKVVLLRGINVNGALLEPFGGDQAHKLMITITAVDEIKKMIEPAFEYNKKLIDYCEKRNIMIPMMGFDMGTTAGMFMSPDTIREVFIPLMKMINDEIIRRGMIPFFHSCGRIWEIMDDMVELGYRGYQSVQASAGMDWKKVKEKYGDKLAIWAGVQCETLIQGSLEDVEKEVKTALEILKPGGGFIFGSTNSVQFGANTDNYLKALEIVREYGNY